MSEPVAVIDYDRVLATVSPGDAVDLVRAAFLAHARGEVVMPSKVYLSCPPDGDFRAMPARSNELAILKWVTSFPGNPTKGLPTVFGTLFVSSATTGELLAIMDARSVTALRTGAAAAVATQALARADARSVGLVGCGLHGAWAARCLAAVGYSQGVCADARTEAADAVAAEVGWSTGSLDEALAQDIVVCVTPGSTPIVRPEHLRPGQHLNMLGADGPDKAEAEIDAVLACTLFCDEWHQASHGGELTGAVDKGLVSQGDVTEIGPVLTGESPGRTAPEQITMFDSTGLAIQDLAIAEFVYRQTLATAPRVNLG